MGIVSSKGGMYLEVRKIFSIKYTNKYLNRYPNLFTILIPALLLKACGGRDLGASTILSDNVAPYSGYPGEINTLFLEGNPYSLSDGRNDGFITSLTQKQFDGYGYGNIKIVISGLPTDEQFQFRMVIPEEAQSSYDDVSSALNTEIAVQYANANARNIQNGQGQTQYEFPIYSIDHLSFLDSLQLLIPEDYNYQEVEDQEIILTISMVVEIKIPGSTEETILYPLESKAYAISLNQQPTLKLIGTQKIDKINEGQTQMREQIATYEFRDPDHSETMFDSNNFLLYYIKVDGTIEQIADNGRFIARVDKEMGAVQISVEENKLFSYDDNSGKLHVEQQGTEPEQKFFQILIAAFDDISKKYITQGNLIYKTDDQGNPYIEIPTQVGNQEVIKVISSDSLQILRLGVIDQAQEFGINLPDGIIDIYYDEIPSGQMIVDLRLFTDPITVSGGYDQEAVFSLLTSANPYNQINGVIRKGEELFRFDPEERLISFLAPPDYETPFTNNGGHLSTSYEQGLREANIYSFILQVYSQSLDKYEQRTFKIHVNPVNEAPVVTPISRTISIDLTDNTADQFETTIKIGKFLRYFEDDKFPAEHTINSFIFRKADGLEQGVASRFSFSYQGNITPFDQEIRIDNVNGMYDEEITISAPYFIGDGSYEFLYTVEDYGGLVAEGSLSVVFNIDELPVLTPLLEDDIVIPEEDDNRQTIKTYDVSDPSTAFNDISYELYRIDKNNVFLQVNNLFQINIDGSFDDFSASDKMFGIVVDGQQQMVEFWLRNASNIDFESSTDNYLLEDQNGDKYMSFRVVAKDGQRVLSALNPSDYDYQKDFNVYIENVDDSSTQLTASDTLSFDANLNAYIILSPENMQLNFMDEDYSVLVEDADNRNVDLTISLLERSDDYVGRTGTLASYFDLVPVLGEQGRLKFEVKNSVPLPDYEAPYGVANPENLSPIDLLAANTYKLFFTIEGDEGSLFKTLSYDVDISIENVDDSSTQFTASDTLSFDANLNAYIILSPENMQLNFMDEDYSVLVEDADNNRNVYTTSLLERSDDYVGRTGTLASYFDLVPVLGEQGRLKFEVKNSVPLPDYHAPYGVVNPENLSSLELQDANTYKLSFTIEGYLSETLLYNVDISIVNDNEPPFVILPDDDPIQLGSIPFGRKASFDISEYFIRDVFGDQDGSVEKIFFTSTPDDVSYIALAPESLLYTNLNSHLEVIENSKYDIDVGDTTIVIDTAAFNDQDKKYYVGSYRVEDNTGDSSLDTVRFSFTVDAARGFAPSLSLGQIFARSDQDGEKIDSYYSHFTDIDKDGIARLGVTFFSYSDQDIFDNTRSDEYLIIDAQNVFIKAEGKDSYFLQHSDGGVSAGSPPDFFPQQGGEYVAVDLNGDTNQGLVVLNGEHLDYYSTEGSMVGGMGLFENQLYSYKPKYFNEFRGIEPVFDPFYQITITGKTIYRAPVFVKFGANAPNYDFVVVDFPPPSSLSNNELHQYSIVTDINDDSYGYYELLSPEHAYVSVIKGAGTGKEVFNKVFGGSMPVFTDVDRDGKLDMFVIEAGFTNGIFTGAVDMVYYHYDPNGLQGPSFYDDNVNKITFSDFAGITPNFIASKLYALDLEDQDGVEGQDGWADHLLLTTRDGTSFLYSFSIIGNTGTLTEIYFNNDFSNNFLPPPLSQGDTPRAIAFGDLDNDGDVDLVLAVQDSTNNIKIRYYQNQGGDDINFEEQSGDDNPFALITIGDGSYKDGKLPYMELFDIDLDGDLDFIFGDGKSNNDGIKYCLNTDSARNPSYASAIDLLAPINLQNDLDISFEILKDNQGNDVVVAVVAVEDVQGITMPLYYYQIEKDANTGILTLVNPVQELENNIDILVAADIRSAFYDVDGDGLVDMVFGEEDGSLSYYRAERDATGSILFSVESGTKVRDFIISDDQYNSHYDPFDGLDFGSNVSPSFVDLDGDFEDELVVINNQGDIFYIENSWIDAAWTSM